MISASILVFGTLKIKYLSSSLLFVLSGAEWVSQAKERSNCGNLLIDNVPYG